MGWNCAGESLYELSSSRVEGLAGGGAWPTKVRIALDQMQVGFYNAYYHPTHKFYPAIVEALLGEEAFDPWATNALPQFNHEQNPAEYQVWRDRTGNVAPLADGYSRSARSAISEDVLEALRSADRKGRDVVVGLSNACCKWGCSKSEISSLC